MRCSKCKNKLQKNAKFCPVCGTKVKKRRMKKFLIFFSILIVVISGIGIAGWKMGALDSFLSPDKESVMSRTYKIKNSRQAIAHAKKFGEAYGYKNAFSELTEKDISVVDGDSYYRLQQNYKGIPVYNAEADYNVEYGFEAPKIVRKEISGELVDAYAPIFLEYQQAINTYDESNTAQFSNEFPDVREILVKSNKYNGTEIWYGFYDIDGNGMEELLLATEDAQAIGGYRIADVFTYDMTGVQIKNIGKDIISSEDIATGQYNSVIYDTGIFRINKSDSEEFYNISADESYMELVKRYNRLENSSGEIYYFDDSEMLSYDKFMQHVLERKGDIAEIEWLKLSEVTVL